MNSPLISIITVCRNEVSTVEATIKSILEQTYTNWELIVIDGASQDGTLEILKIYENKIAHLLSEPDTGIYNAMNKGIKLAKGDFLYFLNANDTLYDNNIFEKVTAIIEEHPDKKLFFGDVNFKSKENRSHIGRFGDFNNIFMFLKSNLNHQSIFYHRTLFKEFGLYDESLKMLADTDFNMKLLIKAKLTAVHCPFIINNFQLGGFSSDFLLAEKETKIIRSRYFKNLQLSILPYKIATLFKFFAPNFIKKNKNTPLMSKITNDLKEKHKINLILHK